MSHVSDRHLASAVGHTSACQESLLGRAKMRTWLLVAAERREFDGIVKRLGRFSKMDWPGARFARQSEWQGDRWLLVANGPGPDAASNALRQKIDVSGIISTGFCGALDPALRLGDIV